MKYSYRPSTSSVIRSIANVTHQLVPAALPALLPSNDNAQDLLRRKRETELNRRRYHLTEADCKLLLTNAHEFSFSDGQIIGHQGDVLPSAYRIKSGTVILMKEGRKLIEYTAGWFLGESVFLNSALSELHVDIVAGGPVVLAQMNIPFVQRLFEVDKVLAQKFYRNVAAKMAVTYLDLISAIAVPLQQKMSPRTRSASDPTSSSTTSPCSSPRPPSPPFEKVAPRRKLSKRQTIQVANAPFKVYPLQTHMGGTKTLSLKAHTVEIKLESFGLKYTKKIAYLNMKNFVKTSDFSITLVADNKQAETLFFKNKNDLEEFHMVFQTLLEQLQRPSVKSFPNSPLSSPPALSAPTDGFLAHDKETIAKHGVRQTYKKGDVIVAEGDLFQRVYLINSGAVSTMLHGCDVHPLQQGDSFGIMTILHLRPFPTTMVVTSETAEVTTIPAFELLELISASSELGARIFQRAAKLIGLQIERLIRFNRANGNLVM